MIFVRGNLIYSFRRVRFDKRGSAPHKTTTYRAYRRSPSAPCNNVPGCSRSKDCISPLFSNDSAVKVLGDETLRAIARELLVTVRANVTIDWTVRENVRAHLRVLVKRILRRNGYPPDKQEQATHTVLEQAEALSREWAVA
jgi:hypothetical protein